MFKQMKQQLLNQNSMGRYLSYAAGEVVLIVVGILVALSIDNWNEERQQNKAVNAIFSILISDLQQDTAEVNRILAFYNKKKDTFLKVAGDSLTKEEIGQCDLCPNLISSRQLFSLNKRGFFQLNEFNSYSVNSQDTLIFDIVNFYSASIDDVENFNEAIDEDIIGNLTYWRDHYSWFAASLEGTFRKENWNYFKSQEYRNKVAFHYVLIYKNYLPILHEFQRNSQLILQKLNKRLPDHK